MKNKINKNKKAQLKIQEMAFVLVAVIILFGFVLIFFTRFQLGTIQQSAAEIRREQAINMLHTIAAMPELRCSSGSEINCIDKSKLDGFMKIRNKYNEFWKNAFITKVKIEEFYPQGKEYIIYSGEDGSSVSYSTYIPLCEQQTYDLKCIIGKITVSSKSV
jgi:flagellar basal body-associated protein FliL